MNRPRLPVLLRFVRRDRRSCVLPTLLSLCLLEGCSGAPETRPADIADPTQEYLREGYRQVTFNGQLMYCRDETTTGSAFTRRNCLTAADMRSRQDRARKSTESMQGRETIDCTGNPCR